MKYSAMLRKEDVERNWYEFDAEGVVLGRLASEIATLLIGKRKPTYTPHIDNGDFVVVVNADKIAVTGTKMKAKKYYRHSGFPGGLKERTLEDLLIVKPEDAITFAVKRMLPKNKLGSQMLTRLKVYAGPEHQNAAQKPEKKEL